ncbi:MAG: AarF/UbiB family protein [Candidatus Nanohaloarchaea archaeon]|nr:AarF/UbiB family protein [Candidatus Nanohaloarchaea archaeon]
MVLSDEIEDVERLAEIIEIFTEAGFAEFIERAGLRDRLPLGKRIWKDGDSEPSPVRLRNALEQLGPTFIKLGQTLAQRPDIIPQPYIEELEKLENQVEPIESSTVRTIIEDSLGQEIDEIFDKFDDDPIGSASVAQVHRARLTSGEDVAVKVIKPDVREKVETDLRILQALVKEAEFASKKLRQYHVTDIFEQFKKWTRNALDLRKEARNAHILKENLRNDPEVYIPKIYDDYTTERIMVAELIEGTRPTNTAELREKDVSSQSIAQNGVRTITKQVARDGFFHADPHPSNLFIDSEGRINYVDFGIVGQINKTEQRQIALLMLQLVNENAEGVVNAITKMAMVDDDADLEQLEKKINEIIMESRGRTLAEKPFSYQFLEILRFGAQNGVHLPTTFAAAAKGLLEVEGIALKIYPDLQLTDEVRPIIRNVVWSQNRPDDIARNFLLSLAENRELIEDAPRNAAAIIRNVREQSGKRDTTLKVDTRTLGVAMVAVALIVTGTLFATGSSGRQLIGILELAAGLFLTFRLLES